MGRGLPGPERNTAHVLRWCFVFSKHLFTQDLMNSLSTLRRKEGQNPSPFTDGESGSCRCLGAERSLDPGLRTPRAVPGATSSPPALTPLLCTAPVAKSAGHCGDGLVPPSLGLSSAGRVALGWGLPSSGAGRWAEACSPDWCPCSLD